MKLQPCAQSRVLSALSGPIDRIGHMLSGISAKVAVKVFGPDLDETEELVLISLKLPEQYRARRNPFGTTGSILSFELNLT